MNTLRLKRTSSRIFPDKLILFLFAFFVVGVNLVSAQEKPRVFVLTDIENEPDDAMSMVRFLVYANNFEIEGLAATTSTHQRTKVATYRVREIVEAYSKVRDNLEKHEPGFPTGDYLKARITDGLPLYGMEAVGEGHNVCANNYSGLYL